MSNRRLGVSLLMDISSFKQRAYPYRFVMNQKEADLSWFLDTDLINKINSYFTEHYNDFD